MNTYTTILFLIFSLLMPSPSFSEYKVKEPNVAGQFYPANKKELSAQLDDFFSQVQTTLSGKHINIIIVPHAGYIYSGGVAAYGYKAVSGASYKTIVILAPSHYYPFDGISVWTEGAFRTPLGDVSVDNGFAQELSSANAKFQFEPSVFEKEHSVEVEIPFLQKTFKDFKIVPVIMGQPSTQLLQEFATTLDKIVGTRDDVLIVVSSDMSHYHQDAAARAMDSHTLEAIKAMDVQQFYRECYKRSMEMCGFIPVTAALLYAKERGLDKVEVLKYANSGDVTGDKSSVVGYSATVIYSDESGMSVSSLSKEQKRQLIDIAKTSINEYVKEGKMSSFKVTDPRLMEKEGAFVTIKNKGQLRGCIGNIIGTKPLSMLVREMAVAAATSDPRFPAVAKEELKDLEVEVSVLSKPQVVKDASAIKEGVHGVIVSHGEDHQGVFLPQVWESLSTKEEFLSVLCTQKAGLPADCWKDPNTTIEVFTADFFSEKDVN